MSRSYAFLLEDVMKNKFNFAFDQKDLWNFVKNKEIKTYNIKDIKHWIYKPCWSYNNNGIDCYYSIYQVLQQKNKFRKDWNKIKKANIEYPLIIIEDEYDKYGCILDGNHRFAQIIINKEKKVKYQFITKKELKKLIIKL